MSCYAEWPPAEDRAPSRSNRRLRRPFAESHTPPLGLGAPYTTSAEEDIGAIWLPLFADELTGRIDFQGDRYNEHHMPLVDKLPDT
ncbi:hypothetical protein [Streptomyces sp. NPDC002343]